MRNPEYDSQLSLITDDLGLSLSVNPELTCATEIARSLRLPSAMRADAFADGHVELLQLILSEQSPLAGKTLMELPVLTRSNVLIGAVERGGSMVTIPGGSFRLEAGDRILLICTPRSAQTFFRQVHLAANPIRHVMLVGGGRIAYYLARQLLETGWTSRSSNRILPAARRFRSCCPRRRSCTATVRTRHSSGSPAWSRWTPLRA